MESLGLPETSVTNFQPTLGNIPEEGMPQNTKLINTFMFIKGAPKWRIRYSD
jgi:hypothetical protein